MKTRRKLVAALACRNNGSRLYGKPLQNLDIEKNVTILDQIVSTLKSINVIDDIVLAVSNEIDNSIYKDIAKSNDVGVIYGDNYDVLQRLIDSGRYSDATDIFRITSESPFIYTQEINKHWNSYQIQDYDALFLENIIDGCGYEIISMDALIKSHSLGNKRHRSELCSLYIRENIRDFKVIKVQPPKSLIRRDLRLTVDNPEDLIVCRAVYKAFEEYVPFLPLDKVVKYLDDNNQLVNLISPYVEDGYSHMYI